MNYFTKDKVFKGLVLLLVLLNVSSLGALWWSHKGGQSPPGSPEVPSRQMNEGPPAPHRPLAEQLEFSVEQEAEFEKLRNALEEVMGPLQEQLRTTREAMFEELKHPGNDSLAHARAEKIGDLQAQVEQATFDHFTQVRAICTPEQAELFDEIIQDALRAGPPGRRGPRHGHGPPHGGPPPGRKPPRLQ